MRELPSGTVTMLFSDIEGSTSMLHRLGPRWGEALSAQRSILREVFDVHHGWEMGTEGDSFFVVFARAEQALRAAVEGQRRLLRHDWPDGVALRIRMGLHTGEPQRHEDGYIGIDIHRAARIAATASGAQIVLSSSTQQLVAGAGIDVNLRELGWHRLKDLAESEQLFDVTGPQLPEDFPPLRSLGALASLPTYATELVGRTEELRAVGESYERGARLVTLTGPGGTGKTRLAVAAAREVQCRGPCDLYFVELHTADRAALMWSQISEAVGAPTEVDVLPHDRVVSCLRERTAFLVLDNLEQIADAEVVVAELLNHAPKVRILATSRRPLHLVDERVYPVEPLPVPTAGSHNPDTAGESGAVELFVRRAAMVQPRFALTPENTADVVALCRHLDGLPLALELMAARARLLSPRAMLRRIEQREVGLPGESDRTHRQSTVAQTVAWSYDLLDEADQLVFRRLGVFSDRVDLTAVESIVASEDRDALDAVAHLVDVSLLDVGEGPDGEPRVSMLQTVRRFAREQLRASGEDDEIRFRHARWCTEVVEAIVALLHGPNQMKALDRMDAVEQDIRAALDWCLVAQPDGSPEGRKCGYELLHFMNRYWYRFGYVAEGHGWHERGLAVLDGDDAGDSDSAAKVEVLHGAGIMLLQQNQVSMAQSVLERALEAAERLQDTDLQSRACNSLGVARREAGQTKEAQSLIERSIALARETGNALREATALTNLVNVYLDVGEYAAAVEAGRRAIAADEALGDPWGVAISECNLAFALLNAEGPDAAYAQLDGIATGAAAMADTELTIEIIECLAAIWAALGDAERSARLLGAGDAHRDLSGIPRTAPNEKHLSRFLTPAMRSIPPDHWARNYTTGRRLDIDAALTEGLAKQEVGHEG